MDWLFVLVGILLVVVGINKISNYQDELLWGTVVIGGALLFLIGLDQEVDEGFFWWVFWFNMMMD